LTAPRLAVVAGERADAAACLAGCEPERFDSLLLPDDLCLDLLRFAGRLALPVDECRGERGAVTTHSLRKPAAQLLEPFGRLPVCALRLGDLFARRTDRVEAARSEILSVHRSPLP
jgi:hypothetical protein